MISSKNSVAIDRRREFNNAWFGQHYQCVCIRLREHTEN